MWSPTLAEAAGKTDFVHQTVVHNKKEAGIVSLHKGGYETLGFFERLSIVSPLNGSDWSQEEKDTFHKKVLSTRKDFSKVAESMGKSMNNCLAYYFSAYKLTADYVEFKSEFATEKGQNEKERKSEKQKNPDGSYCLLCNGGGELLCCGGCDKTFHLSCINPLEKNPVGEWYCDKCRRKRSIDLNLLQNKRKKLNGTKGMSSLCTKHAAEPTQDIVKPVDSVVSNFQISRRFSRRLLKPPFEVTVV